MDNHRIRRNGLSKKMNKEKEDKTRMINGEMKRALDGIVSREVPVEGVPGMTLASANG